MKNNEKNGKGIIFRIAGFPVSAGKKMIEFFFSRSLPVKLFLGMGILLMFSAILSVLSVFMMIRTHVSVPFKAMGLSQYYKPKLLFDSDFYRSNRRAVGGMKAAADDPWEDQYPLEKLAEEEEARLNLLREKYQKLKGYQKLQEVKDFSTLFEFHKFWSEELSRTDFSSLSQSEIEELDRRFASILDLDWEDICAYGNADVEVEASIEFSGNILWDYILHKRANDETFDTAGAVVRLLRYSVLKSFENNANTLWARLTAAHFFAFIHRMCRENLLTASEAEKIYKNINEVYSPYNVTPSIKTTQNYINATRANLLYAYQLSPFGTWLLMKTFGDPLEAAAAHLELLKVPPTKNNEEKFRKQPVNFVYYLEQRGRMPALEEARLIFGMDCREAIVMQMLLDAMGSDERIIDPYSSKPLLVAEKDGRKIYYSSGPNLKDDKTAGDDICWDTL